MNMTLSYFDKACGVQADDPRVLVLEVRPREKPQDDPVAWIVVERHEERSMHNGRLVSASLALLYRVISPADGRAMARSRFEACYSHYFNTVNLISSSTSGGAIFLDLPGLEGQRIGTYLMNKIVQWAKQWPDADVQTIYLKAGQATDDNKARRNRFYEQFGITFDWADESQEAGASKATKAGHLASSNTWAQNIKEINFWVYIDEVSREAEQNQFDIRNRDQCIASIRDTLNSAST